MIRESNAQMFYEIELFPAVLINEWEPAHVALFHNGYVVVTGIKSVQGGHLVLQKLLQMIQ